MFNIRLKQLRIEKELLQKDVAAKINITTSAYGFYEQGKRMPDAEILIELADFFDVSIDYLLGKSDILNPYKINSTENSKAYYYLDTSNLPDEGIEKVKEYIDLLRHKYNKDNNS